VGSCLTLLRSGAHLPSLLQQRSNAFAICLTLRSV
jgi:hypothetical protein